MREGGEKRTKIRCQPRDRVRKDGWDGGLPPGCQSPVQAWGTHVPALGLRIVSHLRRGQASGCAASRKEEREGRGEAREGWVASRDWEEVATKGLAREGGMASRGFVSWGEMMVVCDEERWRRRTPFYTRPEQHFLG